ncbi:uncharacterized protein LY79DRAFT_547472 [Colletotrichum navitas]|uniref:Uncharacterized protein n=1 Tax=Colletotrichum navitas TaxID=681940 RepID=A0AAD8V5U1_9PEZI|nr:uncharacterized protein LY79DRAFT_547472 [Colletotrichum navitas]KAK1595352.1 hypothetical protein LY79DRAFT_547472 [Colletotrichum navitas]
MTRQEQTVTEIGCVALPCTKATTLRTASSPSGRPSSTSMQRGLYPSNHEANHTALNSSSFPFHDIDPLLLESKHCSFRAKARRYSTRQSVGTQHAEDDLSVASRRTLLNTPLYMSKDTRQKPREEAATLLSFWFSSSSTVAAQEVYIAAP